MMGANKCYIFDVLCQRDLEYFLVNLTNSLGDGLMDLQGEEIENPTWINKWGFMLELPIRIERTTCSFITTTTFVTIRYLDVCALDFLLFIPRLRVRTPPSSLYTLPDYLSGLGSGLPFNRFPRIWWVFTWGFPHKDANYLRVSCSTDWAKGAYLSV